jgi:branched-chain amino acid transport system substrate-binding protein
MHLQLLSNPESFKSKGNISMKQSIKWGASLACMLAVNSVQAEWVVGRLGSLENKIAAPSTAGVAAGFDLYIERINKAGGVQGRPIRTVFRDDQFKPDLVLDQARRLIASDKVIAIVSPQATPGSVALLKDGLLKSSNVAVIGPVTGASQVLTGENMFPIRASYEDEIAAITRQMKIVFQKRIAYLYYNTSQGPLFEPIFKKIVLDAGLEYAGAVAFDIDPDPARQKALIAAAVDKLKVLKTDAVFAFIVGPTFPLAMEQLHGQLGQRVVRYTFSINSADNLVKAIGVDAARGTVFSQSVPYPEGNARRIVIEYQRDLKARSPEAKPSFFALEGYMTAKVLVEALKRAGPKADSQALVKKLETLGRFDLGDYAVNYAARSNRVESLVDMTIIGDNGKLRK